MTQKEDYQQDLASIRDLMERSVTFISLSGLSGILAGIYALIGAAYAYVLIYQGEPSADNTPEGGLAVHLVLIAVVVLGASLFTGWLMSWRKAKSLGIAVWNQTSKRLVLNLAIPIITGGLVILVFIYRQYWDVVAGTCLIFYGLALLNASGNLYKELRYLGYAEILLGLVSTVYPELGLIFWAIGFGVLHVVYGAAMYRKYDK